MTNAPRGSAIPASSSQQEALPRHIGVLLFDDVEELDAVGPWEVLANWTLKCPADGWAMSFISADGRSVRAAKGLALGRSPLVRRHAGPRRPSSPWRPRHPLADVRSPSPRLGAQTACHHPVADQRVHGCLGICRCRRPGGTSCYNPLGVSEPLESLDSSLQVSEDKRFIDDGDVITSAGVSAGIDMALHLVGRLAGAERARDVRRSIQYDPQPPV